MGHDNDISKGYAWMEEAHPVSAYLEANATLRAIFLKMRGSYDTKDACLDAMVRAVLSAPRDRFPPGVFAAVRNGNHYDWEEQGGWEADYVTETAVEVTPETAVEATPIADMPSLPAGSTPVFQQAPAESSFDEEEAEAELLAEDERERLDDARVHEKQARQALKAASSAVSGGSTPKDTLEAYKTIWQIYKGASEHLRELEIDALKRREQHPRTVQGVATSELQAADQMFQRLAGQYEGFGPQYEVLCRMLADASTRTRAAMASGRTVSLEEYTNLQKMQLQIIAQMQKHTESTKSESVSKDIEEVVEEVMRVIENTIGPSNPTLFSSCVRAVQQRVFELTGPSRALAAPRPVSVTALTSSSDDNDPLNDDD